ncbi:hypothetical protein I4U23_003799 [Adineta vaga]|nr:hypothetical protein I4U23_003799 [Adineta vaga]
MATRGSGNKVSSTKEKKNNHHRDEANLSDDDNDGQKANYESTKSKSSRRSSVPTSTKEHVNDPHLERTLDRPRTIQFQLPLRSFDSVSSLSSKSSKHSYTDSLSGSSASSSSSSLFDSSSENDSDSETSPKSHTRSRSQSSNEDFDVKHWFENDMMEMKHDLRDFCKRKPLILYHEWNAKVCRDQFRALKPNDSSYDKRRRLLNVTVMATTDRAIVKGKYTVNNETVEFNFPGRMKTTLYEHLLKSPQDDNIQATFKTTDVNVVNDDCVNVCDRLMTKGYDPVMLNMANSSTPGGGFRTGASAQEEDLFRRSNYSRSLDINFPETAEKNHKRSYCKSSNEPEPYPTNVSMYPLEDFDAIYTSGLCFFRLDKDNGYAFMDEPLYDVCCIAIAASRDPPVKDGQLSSDIAEIMRKKVETIFAIAHKNKHDSLVLSAFGCGAFHNPPEHVANIFKSVIEQYAGVFRRIDFAIVGASDNSHGNYSIFKKVLDGLNVKAPERAKRDNSTHEMQKDQNSSRHMKKRNECLYGIECRLQYSEKNSTQHNTKYTHPCRWSELCTNQDKEPHLTHANHRAHQCRNRDACKDIIDPVHRAKYRHENLPDFLVPCKYQQKCRDSTWTHRVKYSHGELAGDDNKHGTTRSKSDQSKSKSSTNANYITGMDHYEPDNRSSDHSYSRTKERSTNNSESKSSGSHHHDSTSRRQSSDTNSRTKGEDDHYRKNHSDKNNSDSTNSGKVSSTSKHNRELTSIDKRSHKTECKYGSQCYNHDQDHRSKYKHEN